MARRRIQADGANSWHHINGRHDGSWKSNNLIGKQYQQIHIDDQIHFQMQKIGIRVSKVQVGHMFTKLIINMDDDPLEDSTPMEENKIRCFNALTLVSISHSGDANMY